MNKGLIVGLLAAALIAPVAAQAPASSSAAAPAASAPAKKKAKAHGLSHYKATVAGVDAANHKLKVKRGRGKSETIEEISVPAEVSIVLAKAGKGKKAKTVAFEDVAVGDQMFVYYLGDIHNPKVKKLSLTKHAEKGGKVDADKDEKGDAEGAKKN